MFTDEKMELIYSERKDGYLRECLNVLLEHMKKECKNPNFAIKQADNIWRLFAKRHPELKQDAFANLIIESADSPDLKDKLKRLLFN